MQSGLDPVYQRSFYLFRRKVFKLFGGAFHVKDEQGNTVMYSRQKAFKLREDMTVWADENQSRELLKIKTPQILDFGATYFVTDSTSGEEVGGLARKWGKSMIRDTWHLLAPDQQQVGILQEKSLAGALLSRFIKVVPQKYVIQTMEGARVVSIKQHFNPFVLKYTMTIDDPMPPIDRRLLIAMGILLCAIEGRQGRGGSYGGYGGNV
ncbi:MAG: hypothetical protein R6U36_10895 [Candidatus Fermentibacteraceae bacterium]